MFKAAVHPLAILLILAGILATGCAGIGRSAPMAAPAEQASRVKVIDPSARIDHEGVLPAPRDQEQALAAEPALARKGFLDAAAISVGADAVPPRITALPGGRRLRERIIRVEGKYPLRQISERLGQGIGNAEDVLQREESVADHVLVTCAADVDAQAEIGALLPEGARIERRIGRTGTWIVGLRIRDLDTRASALVQLARLPGVRAAGVDQVITATATPDDPLLDGCWGLRNVGQDGGTPGADINASAAWERTTGSRTVRVGVIDTGIDYTHPDLAANIWINPGESGSDADGNDKRTNGIDDDQDGYVDDWRGWDFANGDNDPMDDHGHGTHCAGTIGAEGGNGVGVAGVCWRVSLVPLKFLNRNGSGFGSDAVAAIDYARVIGLPITSNSWGSQYYDPAMEISINEATAAGMLFVAAAGNNGTDDDQAPFYPASFPPAGLISVAATDRFDELASFSCFGATAVDLGAPGVDILSCALGGGYRTLSGTSMATPHVAGACALMMSLEPDWTAAQVKESLLANASRIPALTGKCVSGGRLDIGTSVQATLGSVVRVVASTISDSPVDGATGNGNGIFEPGETVAIRVHVANSGTTATDGVRIELATTASSSLATVVRGSADVGTVPAAGEADGALPLLVSIAAGAAVPNRIACAVSLTQTGPGFSVGGSVSIPVHVLATVSGHVFTAMVGSDASVAGATVRWSGPASGAATTDADGFYSTVLQDGTYTFEAMVPGVGVGAPVQVTVPPNVVVDFRVGLPGVGIAPAFVTITTPQGVPGHAPVTVTNDRAAPVTVTLLPTTGRQVTASGLWHASSDDSTVGLDSWYYGIDAQRNYETGGRTVGALVFEDVLVPSGVFTLRWWTRRLCGGLETKDVCLVQVSEDQGANWTTIAQATDNTGQWTVQRAWVASYAGERVWVRFWFDSVDDDDNGHPGWRIDQIAFEEGSTDHILGLLSVDPPTATIAPGASVAFDLVAAPEDVFGTVPVTEGVHVTVDDGSISETDVPVEVDPLAAALLRSQITTFADFDIGDHDWHPEAGETVQPSILISNFGGGTVDDAQGTLSISDPYVTVIQGSVSSLHIAPYGNESAYYPLSLSIAADCPPDRLITGTFRITDGLGGDWTGPVSFRVGATWSLAGRVTGGDGTTPLADALVSDGLASATTAADGSYRIDGLHPGRHVFIASKAGYGSQQAIRSGPSSETWDAALPQPQLDAARTIDATVVLGETSTIEFPIGNAGDGSLAWSLCPAIDGYDIATSRQPGGPAFAWYDISEGGRNLRELLQVSYSTGPYPLGLPFPFYDEVQEQVRTCPYGYLSFSSTQSFPDHETVPSSASPADLLAWQWQYQWFVETSSASMDLVDPDTWVLQYEKTYLFGVPTLVTSQVVLKRDGTITCQYRSAVDGIDCTVGIQDAAKLRGAMFTGNGSGLGDGVAVQFRPRPTWLRLLDLRGEVASGQSDRPAIRLDSTGLLPGTHQRTFTVVSNAVSEPRATVTVRLHVLAPEIEVLGNGTPIADGDGDPGTADGTDFGTGALGVAIDREFTIRDGGTADLVLSGTVPVSIDGPGADAFAIVTQPSRTIAAGGTSAFTVRLSSLGRGPHVAHIVIANGIPGKDPYDFAIRGTVPNAAPSAAPDAFSLLSGGTFSGSAPGVLANDADANGDSLTAVLVASTSHGSLTLAADGSFSYAPAAGFAGTDQFTYRADDGEATSAVTTVAITVSGAADGPPADGEASTCGSGSLAALLASLMLAGAFVAFGRERAAKR